MSYISSTYQIRKNPQPAFNPIQEENKKVDAQFNTIDENEKRKLQNAYKDLIQQQTNALNRRGMFGSSVASEDIGKVNYALGQSLAELGGQSARLRVDQSNKNLDNLLGQQQLAQQANQFDANLAYKKQQDRVSQNQTNYKNDLLLSQLIGQNNPFNSDMYLRRILNKYSYL